MLLLIDGHKLNWWGRVEELTSDFLEEKKLRAELQINLEQQEKHNDSFKKVLVWVYFKPVWDCFLGANNHLSVID